MIILDVENQRLAHIKLNTGDVLGFMWGAFVFLPSSWGGYSVSGFG
jgi:hypothetical protein